LSGHSFSILRLRLKQKIIGRKLFSAFCSRIGAVLVCPNLRAISFLELLIVLEGASREAGANMQHR